MNVEMPKYKKGIVYMKFWYGINVDMVFVVWFGETKHNKPSMTKFQDKL